MQFIGRNYCRQVALSQIGEHFPPISLRLTSTIKLVRRASKEVFLFPLGKTVLLTNCFSNAYLSEKMELRVKVDDSKNMMVGRIHATV